MVASIWTPESKTADLADEFRQEVTVMMKDAALNMGCNVEELKYRINSLGVVQIQRMSGEEMLQMQAQDAVAKQVRAIKEARGL